MSGIKRSFARGIELGCDLNKLDAHSLLIDCVLSVSGRDFVRAVEQMPRFAKAVRHSQQRRFLTPANLWRACPIKIVQYLIPFDIKF